MWALNAAAAYGCSTQRCLNGRRQPGVQRTEGAGVREAGKAADGACTVRKTRRGGVPSGHTRLPPAALRNPTPRAHTLTARRTRGKGGRAPGVARTAGCILYVLMHFLICLKPTELAARPEAGGGTRTGRHRDEPVSATRKPAAGTPHRHARKPVRWTRGTPGSACTGAGAPRGSASWPADTHARTAANCTHAGVAQSLLRARPARGTAGTESRAAAPRVQSHAAAPPRAAAPVHTSMSFESWWRVLHTMAPRICVSEQSRSHPNNRFCFSLRFF